MYRPALSPYRPANFLCIYVLVLLCLDALVAFAQPAILPFNDCTSGDAYGPEQKINITTVYGQIVSNDQLGKHLKLVALGNAGQEIIPISNDTGLLSTLFTTSSILSFNIWQNSTFFCSSLRPPSPLPTLDPNNTNLYCPAAAGPLAFSSEVPFKNHQYELMTIVTRLRVVDTSNPAIELACADVFATPLVRDPPDGPTYGRATIVFWVSVGTTIAYWVVVGLARIVAAWSRGKARPIRGLWTRLEGAGYILASAISGERFSTTPALMRFGTPSMREVFIHTQWCTILGMVAVQWPMFAYPYFAQTAWSTLLYNITLTQGANATEKHWDPLRVTDYNPPADFSDQLNDPSSPVFLDASAGNSIFLLPSDAPAGIASLAATIGLRPQDLFGICMALFLCIIGGAIAISLAVWAVDRLAEILGHSHEQRPRSVSYVVQPREGDKQSPSADEDTVNSTGHILFRASSIPLSSGLKRPWWRLRIRPNSFHGSALHGNLVRILMLFHLPLTVLSCYQFSIGRPQSSITSIVLAVLTFIIFSLAFPILLIVRLWTTPTSKLFDETRTLMMLGPLYNQYGHGSQLFACLFFGIHLVYGLTVGCGQKSGTAQAIIILVLEVVASLGTSVWLPWGRGASMGLISFFFCVARITVAVLLVILTPVVAIGNAAGGWVAAAILFILGVMYLAFLLILAVKIIEALIRIIWRLPFDRSGYTVDSGLFGVLGLLGCCGPRRKPKRRRRRRKSDGVRGSSSPTSVSQQFAIGNRNMTPRSSSIGPPSVLRPEQALRPYREDSDDESGYIMGSWQPFPQPSGYGPVEQVTTPPTESPPKSGFARVGGGRAHFESPYSITPNSQRHEFPSVERISQNPPPTPSPAPRYANADTPSNRSTVTVNHQVASGLPPGAMSPARPAAHVRTKSQTAVVEDASILYALQSGGAGPSTSSPQREEPLAPPHMTIDTDDSSSDATQPRRTHWYNFMRSRRMSDGNITPDTEQPRLDSGTGTLTGGSVGRSFVVLRNKRPSSAGQQHTSDLAEATSDKQEDPEGRRSFVVIRGNGSNDAAGPSSARPSILPPNAMRRQSFA